MKRKQGQGAKTKVGGERSAPSLADAIGLLRAARLGEAADALSRITDADPENWQAMHLRGLTAYRQGKHAEAANLLRRCLQLRPSLAEAQSDLGAILESLGRLEEARDACHEAIALKPGFYPAHVNLGNVLKAMGELEEAADVYKVALALEPNCAEAHANLGSVLGALGMVDEAVGHCRRAAALSPEVAEMHLALGAALRCAGKYAEAVPAFHRALEIRPALASAYTDLGGVLQDLGQFEEALRAHEQALTLQPESAEAHNGLGVALQQLGRNAEAADHYRKAVASKPDYAEAWSNLGAVLGHCGEYDEAAAACRRAIDINSKEAPAYLNLAAVLQRQGKLSEAGAACAKALATAPDEPRALLDHYDLRRQACDWANLAPLEDRILECICRTGGRAQPFPLLNIACGAGDQLAAARVWAKGLTRAAEKPFHHAPPHKRGKGHIRIGYLSTGFLEDKAAADLVAELLQRHDRDRFEVFGYSCGQNDPGETRQRIAAACDGFAALGALPHGDAARAIHGDGIDILVDLDGYRPGALPEIAACRPAPIQVSYLGYPATMGADFIDYLIADPFALAMDQAQFYDEKIVHLPHCFRPDGATRHAPASTPARAAYGLPESGFVFCCFDSAWKITPAQFALWMRLLEQVPGAILWLREPNAPATGNLRREAMAHGVDPARLVFAPTAERPELLARMEVADLFLDTFPFSADTAASDALWAGLPVLARTGETFVSRICGSLLHAAGLTELVAGSPEEYEAAALRLARDPGALRDLRAQLVKNRLAAPLFDIGQYARDLEAAFVHMVDLRAAGHPPRNFAVTAIGEEPLEPAAPTSEAQEKGEAAGTAGVSEGRERIAYEGCPLCGSTNLAPLREADCSQHPRYTAGLPPKMDWNRCEACGHVFTAGYFAREAAEAVFGTAPPHERVGHDVEAQREISAHVIEHIIPYVAKAPSRPKPREAQPGAEAGADSGQNGVLGDWLVVGFGNGSMVFTAQEWGFHAVGLDLRRENVRGLAKLGYETYCAGVEDVNFPDRFCVVSMADVLAQVPFPKTALTAAYRLLGPQGVLFLSMPNMETIVWQMLDDQGANSYWRELAHYHNFSRARLYALLEEQGFSPLAYHISERNRACMEVIALRR